MATNETEALAKPHFPNAEAEIENLKRELQDVKSKRDAEVAQLQEMSNIAEGSLRRKLEKYSAALADQQKQNRELEDRIRRIEDQKRHEIEDIKTKNASLEGRLGQANAELASLRRMLSTHNESSDAEVSEGLDSMNGLIETIATDISFQWIAASKGPCGVHLDDYWNDKARKALGSHLYLALQHTKSTDQFAQYLLQMAFQKIMVIYVDKILDVFSVACPQWSQDDPAALDRLFYGRLSESVSKGEGQAVYAHWRSMAHRYLRSAMPQEDLQRRAENYMERTRNTLACATVILCEEHNDAHRVVEESIPNALAPLVQQAFEFARVIRENIITRNYIAWIPEVSRPIDKSSMEVDEGDSLDAPGDIVVCTTRLGLIYTSKTGQDHEDAAQRFKKARIMTKSTLDDIMGNHEISKSDRKVEG